MKGNVAEDNEGERTERSVTRKGSEATWCQFSVEDTSSDDSTSSELFVLLSWGSGLQNDPPV